ncbi:acetyltransferase [Demequina sp. B12]|nr:acetyltransferase [Demequina sp. B12]MDE0573650.1 acetyltransferase [Demequina sp. B12]
MFGASIGTGVVFRPRTRVHSPWNLEIGNDCWIGDGVWFHNQGNIRIGRDVVISQGSFLTTGSHRHATDMGLVVKPITVDDGVWVTSRCMILGGAQVGRSVLVRPMTVVHGNVADGLVVQGNPMKVVGKRFPTERP